MIHTNGQTNMSALPSGGSYVRMSVETRKRRKPWSRGRRDSSEELSEQPSDQGVESVLVLKRGPSMRSCVVFAGIVSIALGVLLLDTSTHWALRSMFCFVLVLFGGVFFEDHEVCEITSQDVKITRSPSLSPLFTDRKKCRVFSEPVLRVFVNEEKTKYMAAGRQVVLEFPSGITTGVTSCCTIDDESNHRDVAQAIADFLKLKKAPA
eukprot:m.207244 g.207244  ORF g.207244 m.207244 type:complete len:208 (+) comp18517_c0_seq1:90-713(+)